MTHSCYYCGTLFETKEEVMDHVEVHSDVEKNREIMARKKQKKSNM